MPGHDEFGVSGVQVDDAQRIVSGLLDDAHYQCIVAVALRTKISERRGGGEGDEERVKALLLKVAKRSLGRCFCCSAISTRGWLVKVLT